MATSKTKKLEGTRENHEENSTLSEGLTKGTFYQVGTVMPVTTTPTSVNQKNRGAERGE